MEEFDFTFPNWDVIPSDPVPKPTEAELEEEAEFSRCP